MVSPITLHLAQLGQTSTKKQYSKCFSKKATTSASLKATFAEDMPHVLRTSLISNVDVSIQTLVVWGDKIVTMTKPFPASNGTGGSIYLGSAGDEIGKTNPIGMNAEHFGGQFTGLVPDWMAKDYKLPTCPRPPDVVPGPTSEDDEGNDVSDPPSLHRLKFWINDDDTSLPKVAVLPVCFPLTKGDPSIPPNHPLEEPFPNDVIDACPAVEQWRRSIMHLRDNNDGHSLTAGGPLLEVKELEIPPEWPSFYNILNRPLEPAPWALNPHETQHHNVGIIMKEFDDGVLVKLGMELSNNPSNLGASGGMNESQSIAALANSIAEATNRHSISNEKELKKANSNTLLKYRVALASLFKEPNQTPTCNPGTPTLFLEELVSASSNSDAQQLARSEFATKHRVLADSDQKLDGQVNITPAQASDGVLISTIRRGRIHDVSFAESVTGAKTNLNVLAFAPAPPDSEIYNERIRLDNHIRAQELAGEDRTKIERRSAELFLNGIITGYSAIHIPANLRFVFMHLTTDFDKSALWSCLKKIKHIFEKYPALLTTQMMNVTFATNLVDALQSIFGFFMQLGDNCDLRENIRRGEPMDPAPLCLAVRNSMAVIEELETSSATRVHIRYYQPHPNAFFFPQYKQHALTNREQQRQPARDQRNTNPDHRDNRSPSRPNRREPTSTPPTRHNSSSNEPGIFVYNGTGKLPIANHTFKLGNMTHAGRLCMNFATKGRSCQWGSNCNNAHVSKMTQLPPDKQSLIRQFVTNTDGLSFSANAGHQQGTP